MPMLYAGYGLFVPLILISFFITLPSPNNQSHRSPLHHSLRDHRFADATIISVGVSSQILLHLFLETLASFRALKVNMVTRWLSNLTYGLTNLVIWITLRYDVISDRLYLALQFTMLSVFIFGHMCALNAIDSFIWTSWKGLGIAGLTTLYLIFAFIDQHFVNFNSPIGNLAICCYVTSILILIQTYYKWHMKYLHNSKYADLQPAQKVCFARICLLGISFLGMTCILVYYREMELENLDVTYITTFSYVMSVNIVAISLAYARKMHFEAAEVSVSCNRIEL